ncbi:glycosyltransferase [Negativibacillus massiliensis]|uniref:glycosyltransferase n=1 Tax=Negativibacillus massiliensis TaxID=1871035 RepID=UPI003AF2A0FF
MGRVFICGYYNYPRGGAASNYVQYLASIFLSLGKEVYAITNSNSDFYTDLKPFSYNGVNIQPYKLSTNKIMHYIEYNYQQGKYIGRYLRNVGITKEDLLIAYSRDPHTLSVLLNIGKNTGAKTAVCLVEWFDESNFKKGKADKDYKRFCRSFYHMNECFDYILPISSTIKDFYDKKGCKTLCIPCLTDTKEYAVKDKDFSGKRIFVFPANGMMKDSLQEMIQAICSIPSAELKKIEFHVCGAKKMVQSILTQLTITKEINDILILHDWMQYSELVELYNKAHFMLLARDDSLMTRANFPSKVPETLTYGIIPICSVVGDYTKYYLSNNEDSLFIYGNSIDVIKNRILDAISLSPEELATMSKKCRCTAKEKFDYRNWIDKINAFFQFGEKQ